MRYDFLAGLLLSFAEQKQRESQQSITAEIGTKDNLISKFDKVFEYMDPKNTWEHAVAPLEWGRSGFIYGLAHFLSEYSKILYAENPDEQTPYQVTVRPASGMQRGLEWTLITVLQLGIDVFDFDMKGGTELSQRLNRLYKAPYGQCLWCSRPFINKTPHPTPKFSVRFIKPDKRVKYCHSNSCSAHSKKEYSPYRHKNCCYGQWGIHKHRFKVALDDIENNKQLSDEQKKIKVGDVFYDFINVRFQNMCQSEFSVLSEKEYWEVIQTRELEKRLI